MYSLKKEFTISCSHRLHDPNLTDEENEKIFGKCNNAPSHGHNYLIILKLESKELGKDGMIMNFYNYPLSDKEILAQYQRFDVP